jgi:hypothetical protein
MIWRFGRGLFRPLGPAWLAFAAYRFGFTFTEFLTTATKVGTDGCRPGR